MCVLAMATGAITREVLDGDPERCVGIRARFSAPAYPGEPLTVVGFEAQEPDRMGFEVLNPRGRAVIRQGVVWTRGPATGEL